MIETTQSLEDQVGRFMDIYGASVTSTISSAIPDEGINKLADAILTTLSHDQKSTIYAFGNGGSYAIGRHFTLSLEHRLRNGRFGIRIQNGGDVHSLQHDAEYFGYNSIFVNVLERGGADSSDLAILLSGSGNSENIVDAANYCRDKGVPYFALTGSDEGKLSGSGHTPIVTLPDQQMGEDAMQVLLHLAMECSTYKITTGGEGFEEFKADYLSQLQSGLDKVSPAYLLGLSESVTHAFLAGKGVYVLSPEGDGASISAEHTAHNLNWDAVYEIENAPKRFVYSTPTMSDYGGTANDRVMKGFASVQQLEKASEGDLLILFAHNLGSSSVQNTLAKAKEQGMEIYVIAGTIPDDLDCADVEYVSLGTDDPYVTADLTQMLGHMTGRVTNLLLRKELGQYDDGDEFDYLVKTDLAQRRLRDNG
ncbi:MAG: SIS domain-containing protein [Candidatus Woesearchaeota archaeon]|nr:SIS domain-containing protein [Candidatus Woesearchaeota archaeon]